MCLYHPVPSCTFYANLCLWSANLLLSGYLHLGLKALRQLRSFLHASPEGHGLSPAAHDEVSGEG